ALGYFVELILVSIGGSSRWHSQPWIVTSYGLVIAGLGCVSIVLVIFQGGYLHDWCTLCLTSAAISITVAAVGANEVGASVQYLRESS
ncbi:MAG TPA: vitamin K epoxide reductase family protein, partial [Terriglobia bacterium]|nr:vitamin K epoxide reductase family protein [Terriglobia bacterium]